MQNKGPNLPKISLTVFGAFILGLLLSTILHELGHAIMMWITGGVVEKITLNPFSWSYTYYGSAPEHPILTSAGGVIFGTVSGLFLTALVWRYRYQPWTLIFIMAGVVATASNGLYWLIDSLVSIGGDATDLIHHGVSKYLLSGIGLLHLVFSVYLGSIAVQVLGFRPNDSFVRRLIVLECGVLPFMLCMVMYSIHFEPDELGFRSIYALSAVLLILLIAGAARLVQLRQPSAHQWSEPSWAFAWLLAAAAIVAILLELLLF